MGFGLFLGFFLISHVLPLSVSAEEDVKSTKSNTTCPESFNCGNLTGVGFPFYDSSVPPDCGFFELKCEATPSPKLVVVDFTEDQWPEALDIRNSGITLHDKKLEQLLGSRSCHSFYYDVPLKKFRTLSYSILRNITLYRCIRSPEASQRPADYFVGYQTYDKCDGPNNGFSFTIYYQTPHHAPSPTLYLNDTILPICTAVTLPMVSSDNYSEITDIFGLFTAEFDLEWHLSEDCSNCQLEGHECWINWTDPLDPRCVDPEKGKKKWKVILPIVLPISASIVIVLALLFIRHRKNKMNCTSYFLSRNTSEPSSNQDLEGGNIYFGVPVFSYAELEEATNSFDASKELGDGGFGTVYFGKLRDGREVAVKRLYEHNFKRMEQFMNEIQILTRLRHRNLVTLYGCTSRRCRELLLVYEYVPNGTVADHLHGDRAKDKYLTWQHRMNIAIETADALAYLHKSDIIHRDVKTNNILLDHNFCVKVADFGLSRLFPNDVSHISTAPQGTPGYVDPEYHQCYQLTDKSDVYSFGVVLIELISSMPAVDISRHRHEINLANLAINRIQRCAFDELIDPSLEYKSDTEVWRMTTSVAELAFRCLQLEKDMRPKMEEVLETLKEIKNCKDTSIDKTDETDEKAVESRRATVASPESEDIVLLKNGKCPSSPNSVADVWASSSSTTSASR